MSLCAEKSAGRVCVADCGKPAPECHCRARYPYTHQGPSVHDSKLDDYLISEASLREDLPELFEDDKEQSNGD